MWVPSTRVFPRPGAEGSGIHNTASAGAEVACEDLAAAIPFIFAKARELEVETGGYSLWGTAPFGGGEQSYVLASISVKKITFQAPLDKSRD